MSSSHHKPKRNINNSIEAYNTYGVSPNHLRFMIQNIFYFPPTYDDCLWKYHLKVIETHEFVAHMKEGMYAEGGREYQVIYHKTDPTKLLRRQDHTEVMLSFRVAQPEFNLLPTVLVKEITHPLTESSKDSVQNTSE